MTEKQLDFIRTLCTERQVPEAKLTELDRLIENDAVSVDLAAKIIQWLLTLPYKAGSQPQGSGIDVSGLPSGRYAVGDVLVKVDNLTDSDGGKWAGWVFVKNGSEYTDEKFGSQRPGNTYYGSHADLLAAILDDPTSAMQAYGRVTGSCGVCGRTLEDEVSVERGLGPVCASRVMAS